jgi:hypothetical protein
MFVSDSRSIQLDVHLVTAFVLPQLLYMIMLYSFTLQARYIRLLHSISETPLLLIVFMLASNEDSMTLFLVILMSFKLSG